MPQVDFYKLITKDGDFKDKINKILKLIHLEDVKYNRGSGSALKRRDMYMHDLLKLCNYNLGILIPMFFPKYIKGKPLDPRRRPFSFLMTDIFSHGFTAIRGSRQIAKSTTFVARQLIKSILFNNFKSMYVCPHGEHKKTYANRFAEMELACPIVQGLLKQNSNLRNNLFYKQYANGSETNIVNCLENVSQARSKTTDELLYDEYQLFDIDLEADIFQCQSASDTPMTVYAGTSTTIDSPLEFRYQQGSQAQWLVKSMDGKQWLDFSDADTLISCIKPQGLICPYTSKPLDVNDGELVHKFDSRRELGMVSMHVPQLIIYDKVRDALEWEKIYKAFLEDRDDKKHKFLEEVGGIPSEEGSREITEKDLRDICVLGNSNELMVKAQRGYYSKLISACDWGGSDDVPNYKNRKSFTVHSILGLAPDGGIDILYIRQYDGMDFPSISQHIIKTHKSYKCQAMAADYGVGMAYNYLMKENLNPNTFFMFSLVGSGKTIKVLDKGAPNHFALNKTESLSQLFIDIKNGPSKIRCYDWEESGPRLQEFLNLYRVFNDNSSSKGFHYHKLASKPDDSLMSVNFGYTLMRIINGDSIVSNQVDVDLSHADILQNTGLAPEYDDFSAGVFSSIVSG
jgi:hypothetical protein